MTALGTKEIPTDRLPVGVLIRRIDGLALVVGVERQGDGTTVTTDRETPKLYGGMSAAHWSCGAWNSRERVVIYGPAPSSWCHQCGHDTAPDQYGRVSPYAVYRDPRGRSLPPVRNLSHAEAHRMADEWLNGADDGRTAHVGIDACG